MLGPVLKDVSTRLAVVFTVVFSTILGNLIAKPCQDSQRLSASRLYRCYNLSPPARPVHVGVSMPLAQLYLLSNLNRSSLSLSESQIKI